MMYTVLLHLLISSAAIVQGRVALAEYGSPSFSSGAPTRSSSHWSRASSGRQLWRTVTESVVERIWHLPRRGFAAAECARHSVHADGQHQSKLYEHDLVLRFQIESAEEADALSRAVDTLLLDVWEFNDQWVDIRLSKTAVSAQRYHPAVG